ncbi:hypothetical protein IGI04_019692 [Brassica rapa subsp. trilocularis]|uniref:Uncharacterized protein n=1 Tax=Brassica rapa subsp. trilocularis TaxID=1813537 RepID=A0ABQ7MGK5_BRACM|nr:hypothetical protein IGI04_019692 [Brassica rapa subsp. trilocularis]
MGSKRSDGGLPQKTLPSPAQPPSENQRTVAEEQRRNEKIVRFTELSRGICTGSKGMKDRPIRCMTSSGTSEGRGDQKKSGSLVLRRRSDMEEKKLADDRVSDEQVKRIELMVSDVDARDTKDEEVKVPEVNGESHGEANLQHITTGEAVPGFVTSQVNGDEGEAGAGNVSETATLSYSENGIFSHEKKAVLLSFGSEKEEKKLGDDRIIHDQVENNILLVSDVDARDAYDEVFVEAITGLVAFAQQSRTNSSCNCSQLLCVLDRDCFENESGAQRNGETVAEYNTVKYASGDSIQVASGEKSLNDSIEVACAGTSSPLERKPISYVKLWSLGYSNKMVGHTGCSMKLDKSGTSLRCNRCVSTNITGVIRFRVELADDDGNDCATFCVVTITLNGSKTLNLLHISGGEGQELPRCLEELAGKDYVFQIRVTPYSFTPNHRTFTISAISDASSFCIHAHAESCTSNPTAVFDGEDGQLTASASNTVEGVKIEMGVDCRERKQPQNAPQTTSHTEDRDFDFI